MAIYSGVDTHPLLSAKSLAISAERLTAQQELAEALLGLQPPAVTNSLVVARVLLGIVLQVNFQVEQGIDPHVVELSQSSQSKQMVTYRDRYLDPRAVAIIQNAIATAEGDGYGVLTSYRTRDA